VVRIHSGVPLQALFLHRIAIFFCFTLRNNHFLTVPGIVPRLRTARPFRKSAPPPPPGGRKSDPIE